jgi:hypothetical protein
MLTPKYYNQLFAYTLGVNESPEMAEKQAREFEQKFNALGKYDQLTLSITMESGNWEEAFNIIGEM